MEPKTAIAWNSTDELLDRYYLCGIPHFQRGLVWGPDSVALLLESLFHATPCGTVILWKPLDPVAQGIPLANGAVPEHLIIDGQQRIRSLHAVFRSARDASEEGADPLPDPGADVSDPAGAGPERCWCVDLTHAPALQPVFGRSSRFSLFRLVADPSHPKARFKHGLVPLYWIFDLAAESRIEQHLETLHPRVGAWPAVVGVGILEQLRAMRSRQLFAVHLLEESATEHRISDVVRLYNRINSAGRRVEAEERAYAMLVVQAPSTEKALREFFASVHGNPSAVATVTHDDLLRRRQERAFGFKLFVRTFVQIATYHLRFSIGTSAFSFDLLASPTFRDRLEDPANAKAFEEMLVCTKETLTFLRAVLREHLHCDDLQMLPETSSLWPVVQMLVRFPGLMEGGSRGPGARAIAAIALRLYLAPRPARELLALIAEINRAQTVPACTKALVEKLSLEDSESRMRSGVASARSLRDRYVLLLYWLLRRRGAKDFSYENLVRLGRPRPTNAELDLGADVEPEKQHLVPYSRLASAYGIIGRVRISAHAVNSIGNLTYISRELNGFDAGLGSDAIDLGLEVAKNPKNCEAHLLAGLEKDFKCAIDAQGAAAIRAAYEAFCSARRTKIEAAFRGWLTETQTWLQEIDAIGGVDPLEQHFAPTEYDRTRRMGYADPVKDAIFSWIDTSAIRLQSGSKPNLPTFKVRHQKRDRLVVRFFPDRIEVEPRDEDAKRLLAESAGRVATASKGTSVPERWAFPPDMEAVGAIRTVLEGLASAPARLDVGVDSRP